MLFLTIEKGAAVWYNNYRIRLYPACLTSRNLSGEKGQHRARALRIRRGCAAICPVPLGAGFCLISPYKPERYNPNPPGAADFSLRLHFILWWALAHLHHSILPDAKILSRRVEDF